MSTKDNLEFINALREIAVNSVHLNNPYDRVRCAEWARKLSDLPDDNLETSKMRNQYIQYLRIQVRNHFLHGPFLQPPPSESRLFCPLAEHLGAILRKNIPGLPESGQISPVVTHRSPDGNAYISAKQVPRGGVLCYMAVSPTGFDATGPQ